MTFGLMKSSSAFTHVLHESFSSGSGSLLLGGLYFTTFVTYTSSLVYPIVPRSSFRNLPADPTNGFPCLSSFCPGASPMNIIPDFGTVVSYTG